MVERDLRRRAIDFFSSPGQHASIARVAFVGERKSLLVVHWRDRSYLLGVSPQAVQVLDSRDLGSDSASYEDQVSRDCR